MFQRFTDRARRVLVLAQEEARELNHAYIGTEHLLLGLIREGDGVAANALRALGVDFDVAREMVRAALGEKSDRFQGSPPFTPRAKKVLELSLREALELRHSYVGTEHLLLGIVREGGGVGAQVLRDCGADVERVRAQVVLLTSGSNDGESVIALDDVHFDATVFRQIVRALGRELRPDLDETVFEDRAARIADELMNQLRRAWTQPGDPLNSKTLDN